MADIGVWMRPEVLAHKLRTPHGAHVLEAWNMGRWPTRLSQSGEHRLFVASNGAWRGYFKLSEHALYNAGDPSAPFTLLFDPRTWTPIAAIPVKRFRSFIYSVPGSSPRAETAPLESASTPCTGPHRHRTGDHRQ